MIHSRIERINELFVKLKLGYDWCQRNHQNRIDIYELFKRSEPIFEELISLGVSKQFSISLLIFGPPITNELVHQFDIQDKKVVANEQKLL